MTVTQEKRRLKMLFYTWMIKNHLKDNSAKGILARSMKAEGDGFPKRRRLKTLIGYLEHRGASQEVMDALVECWEEYENHERENHRTKTGSGS